MNEGKGDLLRLEIVPLQRLDTAKKPIRNYSEKFWELPFKVEDAAFVLKTDPKSKTYNVGMASETEKRAFTLFRFLYKFKGGSLDELQKILSVPIPKEFERKLKTLRPVIFNDYLEKGGGYRKKTEETIEDTDEKQHVVRYYSRKKELGRTDEGPPAGASLNSDISLDETFSFLFHAWGGRTRLPIATFPIEKLATPDGVLSRKQAIEKGYLQKNDQAVSADWGMRCRWRIDDMVSIFGDKKFKSTSTLSSFFSGFLHPSVELFQNPPPTPENIKKGIEFAHELVSRMQYDEDPRWNKLGKKFSKVTQKNISEFYTDYLTQLSRTIGEQLGILYRHKVDLYMLNFQNFTALGEIVDFDVAVFNGKKFIDGKTLSREEMKKHDMLSNEEVVKNKDPDESRLQASTTFEAIHQLTGLFSIFRVNGIINSNPQEFKSSYDQSMAEFGKGFLQEGFDKSKVGDIPDNVKYITHLENIFKNTDMWNDYPNPIIEGIKERKNSIYKIFVNKLQKSRSFYLGNLM